MAEAGKVPSFVERTVGVWEVDGDKIAVWENAAGGLEAKSLETGKTLGAGIVFGGRKVSDLPEGFKPSG